MINKELFDSFSNKTKEELTDEPFSFRECTKCQDYFDLGGSHQERPEEAMYCHTEDFECDEKKIQDYQNKNKFDIDDNVFCWPCIEAIRNELEREVQGCT